jgi:hypothetical protein
VQVLNLLVKPFYILGIDAGVQVRVGSEGLRQLRSAAEPQLPAQHPARPGHHQLQRAQHRAARAIAAEKH